ncbi:MAG: hypothetical protein M3Z05_10950 [Gemmatimonadota bacterium]|nr:hypothetical protein [Gemmatimonadota bacterium]
MRNQQVNALPLKHFQLLTLGQIALRGASGEDAELAKRRRKLALLALLALSRRPPSRTALMEMFWGNLDDDRARHSLSDALSHLRRILGRDTIAIRSEVVELETGGRLAVDAIEFEAACETRNYAHAVELYGGPFLGDFHVERSQTFDDWVSRARDRYARMFIQACESHCAALFKEGAYAECATIATRWLQVEILSTAAAAALLQASLGAGDAALGRETLDEYERWNVRRSRDLGIGADPRLDSIADQIRQTLARRRLTPPEATRALETTPATPIAIVSINRAEPYIEASSRPKRPPAWIGVVMASVAAILILALVINRRAAAREIPLKPAIALVDFRAVATDSSLAWLGEGLQQMVAADLARVPLADVIPPSVVREAAERVGQGASSTAEQRLGLARSVHATMAVSATISRNEGSYVVRVTLQSVDDPRPPQTYTATGSDVLVVADQVAAHVLSEVGIGGQGPRLSDVETSNTEAFRHFVQGQHALDDGRPDDANREFDLAIAADSGFTSAIVARLHDRYLYTKTKPLFDRVRSRLTEWDRMSEAANDAFHDGEHARAEVLAQELEARFPRDPRAIAQLANIYYLHGRFKESERAFLRLLALDSLALMAGHGPCAPCSAVNGLALARSAMGDTAGARRAALRLTELQPGSPGAWALYGNSLALQGATDQGIVALRRTQALMGDTTLDVLTARALLGARRYEEAQALAQRYLYSSKPHDALDVMSTMHRERGEFRAAIPQIVANGTLNLLLGNAFAAIGDTAHARRVIEKQFFDPSRISAGGALIGARRGDEARAFAWDHAQLADALWEHGDTSFLRALADSVETIGAHSYFARDWQLHHHIRGLIALRAGDLDAAEREFSAGMSLFRGWTRTNLLLARVLIAQGHPDRALETLRRAYLEPLDAMGRYAPRTEFDVEMARAYTAMGQQDSARVYSAYVRRAWANADPEIKRRLAQLP